MSDNQINYKTIMSDNRLNQVLRQRTIQQNNILNYMNGVAVPPTPKGIIGIYDKLSEKIITNNNPENLQIN